MPSSMNKPPAPLPTFNERYASALKALSDPSQLLVQYRTIFEATKDPSIPLAVLCTAVDAAGDEEHVTLPAWAGQLLAVGFAQYLDAVAAGDRKVSLEQCLGIGTTERCNIADLATLDEMSKRVHWFRWQFRLKVGVACHVVYSLHIDQCKNTGLSPDKVGITRDEKSFKQHYERKHAKQFQVWHKLSWRHKAVRLPMKAERKHCPCYQQLAFPTFYGVRKARLNSSLTSQATS